MALLVGLSAPIQPASAAYGLTNLVISNENPTSNDIFTVEFEVSRPIGIDQKYQIVITLLLGGQMRDIMEWNQLD
jgi:hypothetical protein